MSAICSRWRSCRPRPGSVGDARVDGGAARPGLVIVRSRHGCLLSNQQDPPPCGGGSASGSMRLASPVPAGGATARGVHAPPGHLVSLNVAGPRRGGQSKARRRARPATRLSLPDLRALPFVRLRGCPGRVGEQDRGDAAQASLGVGCGLVLDGDHARLRATGLAAPRALPLLRRSHLVRPRVPVPQAEPDGLERRT